MGQLLDVLTVAGLVYLGYAAVVIWLCVRSQRRFERRP